MSTKYVYIVVGVDKQGIEYWGKGATVELALIDIESQTQGVEITPTEYYRAEKK